MKTPTPHAHSAREAWPLEHADAVVVGAGVVGLAVARALALAGREVLILEAENAFGTATSARNSEVIHAGIYYPTGSLRAQLCVRGRRLLADFCESHGVAHRRCGKLIVACSNEELPVLDQLQAQALANGLVGDEALQRLSRSQALALEPALECRGALLSPATGIIDSHGLMLALLGDAQAHGALLAVCSPVQALAVRPGGIELQVGGEAPMRLLARTLVNAAGLGAVALAGATQGLDAAQVPRQHLSKGCYFSLAGRSPFSRLIYPAPGQAGHLGVHLTLDLGGQARFGPSFQWADAIDYSVRLEEAAGFEAEVRHYWPGLPDHALQPGYAGMRPKISGPGEPAADFRIDGPARHGVPGLVNLFGIESPGLTACLAIAQQVVGALA
jgi:L-2-hydroxyglutarate oxidase LhgO